MSLEGKVLVDRKELEKLEKLSYRMVSQEEYDTCNKELHQANIKIESLEYDNERLEFKIHELNVSLKEAEKKLAEMPDKNKKPAIIIAILFSVIIYLLIS